MKKLFLLAAIAAPFALFADDPTTGTDTPTPVEPKPLLGYSFPAGSFFTIGENPVAILPWSTEQTFTNNSAFQGEPYVDGDWYWQYKTYDEIKKGGNYDAKVDLTYSAKYTAIPTNFGSVAAPILYDMTYDANGNRITNISDITDKTKYYQWDGKIAFGNIAEGGSTVTVYNPAPALAVISTGASKLFAANGSADNEWYNMYGNIYSSISVEGVAQRITYPGRPYTISGLTVNTVGELKVGESFTVSIYEAPTEGTTLPEQPITSQILKVEKAGTAHEVSFINTPTVTSDIIIVINEFSTTDVQPSVAIATAKEGATDPTTEGIMALVRLNNEEFANNVLSWDEAIDGALPVALDMTLTVKYVFFYPYMESPSSSDDPIEYEIGEEAKIEFANGTSWAQLICKSSTTNPNDLIITLADGSELPYWLTVEPLAADSDTEVLVNFSCNNSSATGNAIVKIQVPGNEYALFNVVVAPTTGIDNVASDAAIVAREFYDLSGRRLAKAPTSGFFIEKSIRADGTSTSATRAN